MKQIKKLLVFLGVMGMSASAWATTTNLSGTFGATTNYLWRGVSYSKNLPAIQGGLDYRYQKRSNDLSVGTWISSSQGYGDGLESDFYGQYSYRLSDSLSLHVAAKTIHYPHNMDTDYGSYTAGMRWRGLTVNVEQWSHESFGYDVKFSRNKWGLRLVGEDNYFNTKSRYHYSEITRSFNIDKDWNLGLVLGYSTFDKNTNAGYSDHYNYMVSLSRQLDGFTSTLFINDTNRKNPSNNKDVEDRTVGLSFVRSF